MVAVVVWYFFFSSRRRHTRFDCDWSSDVCSSDLGDWSFPKGARMYLLDRLLVRSFIKSYAICLISLLTLYIVVDLFTNLDDYMDRSEEHTSELQSQSNLVCRLLLEKKKK